MVLNLTKSPASTCQMARMNASFVEQSQSTTDATRPRYAPDAASRGQRDLYRAISRQHPAKRRDISAASTGWIVGAHPIGAKGAFSAELTAQTNQAVPIDEGKDDA